MEIINKLPKMISMPALKDTLESFYIGNGVEIENCEYWFHAKCQHIDDQLYAKMKDMVLNCSNCQKIIKLDNDRYVLYCKY